jgi:opacity protein-like surface antigen
MTKKTTTICCAVALLATTATTPVFSQTKNFQGPMIGLGVNQTAATTNTTITSPTNSVTVKYDNGDYSTIPFVDASYSIPVSNNFLFRIGGRYDFSKLKSGSISSDITAAAGTIALDTDVNGDADLTNDVNAGTIREQIKLNYNYKDHYSIYVAPTYVVNNNSAFFGKIGWHTQKGTLKYTETYTFADPENDDDGTFTNTSVSGSKTFEGWGYGLGYIHSFGNTYIQLDAEFIDYDKKSFKSGDVTYSFKPESLNASISVGYKF